jgi:hypothetical protein
MVIDGDCGLFLSKHEAVIKILPTAIAERERERERV